MRILPSVTLAAALAATSLTMAVTFSAPALADGPDPSVHQIYEAEAAGNYGQAQQMIDQVLKDHPKSATAHFVQAELYAKQGKTAQARSELAEAQEIDPALSKVSPRAAEELKAQLGLTHGSAAPRMMAVPAPQSGIHWGLVFIVVLAVIALWALFRRRNTYQQYGGPAMTAGPGYGAPPGYGGPAGYGAPPMGGGVGSGIAGGLASGLAVGAGVVAGEELAHHFLDGDRREGTVLPSNDNGQQNSNSDMGGNDFGVNDSSGWDDSSGGGGGGDGGGDWS
jgi:hypothetical protein